MSSETEEQKYSVLMSVYAKEKAEYLQVSIESIFTQTVLPDDFVLVCDGPLSKELNEVISSMKEKYAEAFQIVRLEKNAGLGNALNHGLKFCKNELVARMDSDDISRPERCEKQLHIFKKYPAITIVSGSVEEFEHTPEQITVQRALPEQHEDIVEFAKKRNPFNHPCVMYKKSAVEAAGGYQDFYLLEDYYLWIRMLRNGCKGYNLQDSLLWMRAGNGMYRRRSGWKYAKSQIRLLNYLHEIHLINKRQKIQMILIRVVASMLPNQLRKKAYKVFARG